MSDKLQRAYGEAEDRLTSMMKEMHERGELAHLKGKPLPLEDDDPAWLVTRMLKQEGFSHPLLERRQEVEQQLRTADARIDRLVQRRQELMDERDLTPPQVASAFNTSRGFTLEEYRESLPKINRSIRDYNLTVPLPLHITPVQVETQMQRVEELVPALDPARFGHARRTGSWWTRLRHSTRTRHET